MVSACVAIAVAMLLAPGVALAPPAEAPAAPAADQIRPEGPRGYESTVAAFQADRDARGRDDAPDSHVRPDAPDALASLSATRTWYVDDATGSDAVGDGSASNPLKTITAAIATASAGDRIELGPGVYDEESFPLRPLDDMVIASSMGAAKTSVDASGTARVFACNDLSFFSLEGVTVTGGRAGRNGGGLNASSSWVEIIDCVFEDNTADAGGAVMAFDTLLGIQGTTFKDNGWGGAVVEVSRPASLEVTMPPLPDFDPDDITCTEGGAVAAWHSYLYVEDSDFVGNAASLIGGGVSTGASYVEIYDSGFSGNIAWGGALSPHADESPALSEGLRPAASPFGEAIGGSLAIFATPDFAWLEGITFEDSLANWGGALYVEYTAEVVVVESAFSRNRGVIGGAVANTTVGIIWSSTAAATAETASPEGPDQLAGSLEGFAFPESAGTDPLWISETTFEDNGGEYAASAVFAYTPWSFWLENCLVARNVDPYATVWHLDGGTAPLVNHCTFAANQTTFSMETRNGPNTGDIFNSIFWGNDYGPHAGVVDVLGPDVYYSDLEWGYFEPSGSRALPAITPGFGNISADPQFRDAPFGDYRPTFGSPVVDTASSDGWMPPYDLSLTDRPLDGDLDGTEAADMGCYELAARESGTAGRFWGEDRYETSVRASQEFFPNADVVVLATGRTFADGLAASGLAGAVNGPVLLTRPGDLPGEIVAEIRRLGADHVIIVGGVEAVLTPVKQGLAALGLTVERIGGADRYETAALIAERIALESGEATPPVTFIARGDLWADALAASPVAFARRAPVLLVRPHELPAATVDVLQQSAGLSTVIVGGKSAVDPHVAKGIVATAASLDRVSGADRYETAAALSEYAVSQGWSRWDVTGLATGHDFADSLAGGPGLGRLDGVMLLTAPEVLSPPARSALTSHAADITRIDLLGGADAIAPAVMAEARAIIE